MQTGFCASERRLSTPRKAAIGAASVHIPSFAIIRKLPPKWRYRLGVRTEDSQSSNPGSIPGSATNYHFLSCKPFQALEKKAGLLSSINAIRVFDTLREKHLLQTLFLL